MTQEQSAVTPGGHVSGPRLAIVVPATNKPPTLERCLAAIERARTTTDELIVVDGPAMAGPAEARNLGAAQATADVIVFVDADVVVHEDALRRIRAAFTADPDLTALFGSYDDQPAKHGLVSSFRNLLHHYVHQRSAGPVGTFWAGLGAVRREVFAAVGGFDAARFPRPTVEDIELGMRLAARGSQLRLDPSVQGTHLKEWTLRSMIRTDFSSRGVPWVGLLLRERTSSTELNLGWGHRLSTAACLGAVGAAASRRYGIALGAATTFVVLNHRFYSLLLRRRGPVEAGIGVALHGVHHLTGAAAVPAGVVRFFSEERRGRAREATSADRL
jgi:glycosyltransferase involved in cell wall biosynthesis